jgi:hypothetical protein
MMTEKEWHDAMAEIHNLRFQLIHKMVPEAEHEKLRARLKSLLESLAREVGQS